MITVNGEPVRTEPGTTVAALVHSRTDRSRGVAVARNGEVVPRTAWATTELSDGDAVEVLAPVAGG